jgi:hypothetical protein
MSEQAVPGRKKTWWAWGGLVAAALVIVVGVSRLAPFAMGGTSGSSAAAPAPEPAASAESAYGAIAGDQEMEYAASQAEADGATQEEQTFPLRKNNLPTTPD